MEINLDRAMAKCTIPILVDKDNLRDLSLLGRIRNFFLGGKYQYIVTDNKYYSERTKTGVQAYRSILRRWRQGFTATQFRVYREFDKLPPLRPEKPYYVHDDGTREELSL